MMQDAGRRDLAGNFAEDPAELLDGVRRITRLFWFAIALATLTAGYAAFCARDLFYDGALYLLGWAAHGELVFFVPARETVQTLQQVFVIAGERAGIKDVFALARLFSLGTSGWPVLLTAACWPVLPRKEKAWIIGPLLNLAAVIPITSLFGIGEGLLASCVLWLTFLMFSFRLHTGWGAVAAVVLTAACGMTHEVAFPFLAGLALLALMRLRLATGWERMSLALVALLAAAGSLHLAYWAMFPRDPIERSNFVASLLGGFLGTGREPNLPALASIVAAVAIALTLARPKRSIIDNWPVWLAGLVFVVEIALVVLVPDRVLTPGRFFAARALPVLFTTVAAFGMVCLRERAISPTRLATVPVMSILFGLVLTQAAIQLAMTQRWQALTGDMRTLLAQRRGVITFAESSQALNPTASRFRRELLQSWSVEPLGIVLALGGHVQSVFEPGPHEPWVPFHFDTPRSRPTAPGLDWSGFPARPR
jgi:hypothetical protein